MGLSVTESGVQAGSAAAAVAAVEAAQAETYALANAGWNFRVNLLDISFITLGLSLISRETVMPVLVSTLTDSKLAVGLIAAIFSFGLYLPQLLIAQYTERLRYKKPFLMVIGGVGERVPYLLIAVVVWALAVPSPTVTLALFLLLVGIAGFSAGMGTPAWLDLIAKVIPVQRRGLWSGVGHSLGAAMGIAGAYLVGRVLASFPYPNNFALLFALAFVAVTISWVGLALNREPPSAVTKTGKPLVVYLRQLPDVLRRNPNYRAFVLGRMTVILGGMASSFFIVYGRERFAIDAAGIGIMTALLIGSQAVMNLAWGVLGDRKGHKVVLAGAAFLSGLAALAALVAPSVAWLGLTFVLLGAFLAGEAVSAWNIILEFCAPEDRPTYIGLTNTLLAPMVILAPVMGGWLAGAFGYPALLAVAPICAAVGGLLLTFWVREPRAALKKSMQSTTTL